MNVRDLIRKRLENYAERHERRDDQFAELFIRNVDALSDRRTLKIHLSIVGALNFLVWLSVIIFPRDILDAWGRVSELNDKIAAVMIVIVFGLGFWLTYGLFRMKFSDIEEKRFDEEIFNSFRASEHSLKRYRVWLLSTVGGVVNVLLLVLTEAFLVARR